MAYNLGELARLLGGTLKGPAEVVIEAIAPIDRATPRDITFIHRGRYARWVSRSQAAAFIVGPAHADLPRPLVIVPNPYLAYAQVAALFAPPRRRWPGISNLACLGQEVELGWEVSIAPLVFIGDRVRLGDRVTIMAGCVIGREVEIGDDTLLYPNVTVLDRCRLGSRVIIHSGTVIGADGFGYLPGPEGHIKIPQLGAVAIEDDVEIGANCTIDRGALGDTRVGRGVKISNQVQLAHNVTVGDHSLMVAQTGVAGSTKLGRWVVLAGQVGLLEHIELGDGVKVGAQGGVNHSLPAGEVAIGYPARPQQEFLKINALVSRLPQIQERLMDAEKNLAALAAGPAEEPGP
jgi:UDP-3-O-[3-hydroxymyristoyl] glucosamine N-acyltransferase